MCSSDLAEGQMSHQADGFAGVVCGAAHVGAELVGHRVVRLRLMIGAGGRVEVGHVRVLSSVRITGRGGSGSPGRGSDGVGGERELACRAVRWSTCYAPSGAGSPGRSGAATGSGPGWSSEVGIVGLVVWVAGGQLGPAGGLPALVQLLGVAGPTILARPTASKPSTTSGPVPELTGPGDPTSPVTGSTNRAPASDNVRRC